MKKLIYLTDAFVVLFLVSDTFHWGVKISWIFFYGIVFGFIAIIVNYHSFLEKFTGTETNIFGFWKHHGDTEEYTPDSYCRLMSRQRWLEREFLAKIAQTILNHNGDDHKKLTKLYYELRQGKKDRALIILQKNNSRLYPEKNFKKEIKECLIYNTMLGLDTCIMNWIKWYGEECLSDVANAFYEALINTDMTKEQILFFLIELKLENTPISIQLHIKEYLTTKFKREKFYTV